jgi:hypothetical protein
MAAQSDLKWAVMTADDVIEQIRALSKADDLDKVSKAVSERQAEVQADADAADRVEALQSGRIKSLTHEEVLQSVRKIVREG